MRFLITILTLAVLNTPALADTITLKSGKVIEGKILEKTDEYTKINFKGVDLTFYVDEIENKGTNSIPRDDADDHTENKSIEDKNINKGEAIFKKIVNTYFESLKNSENPNERKTVFKENYDALISFSSLYPDSIYADDAEWLILIEEAVDNIDIAKLDNFVKKYPNGKLELFTLNEIEGGGGIREYNLILPYYKGIKAMNDDDYRAAIEHFTSFSKKAESISPFFNQYFMNVSLHMIVANGHLNRKEECKDIYNKAIEANPNLRKEYKNIAQKFCGNIIP